MRMLSPPKGIDSQVEDVVLSPLRQIIKLFLTLFYRGTLLVQGQIFAPLSEHLLDNGELGIRKPCRQMAVQKNKLSGPWSWI